MKIPMFTTYQEVKAFFITCRNKKNGKPLLSPYLITQNGDDFEFRLRYSKNSDLIFAIVRPDDTMEFTLSVDLMRVWSNTLCMTFHKVFPLEFLRVATGRYKLIPLNTLPSYSDYYTQPWSQESHTAYWDARTASIKKASDAFNGLKVHLPTSTYVNPLIVGATPPNKSKQAEWRKMVIAFKRQVKTRARLGVFAKIFDEVAKTRQQTGARRRPDWSDPEWESLLYNAITKSEYPKEFFLGIAESALPTFWHKGQYHSSPSDSLRVEYALENIYSLASLRLRQKFGVFEDDVQGLSDQNEVSGHQMEPNHSGDDAEVGVQTMQG